MIEVDVQIILALAQCIQLMHLNLGLPTQFCHFRFERLDFLQQPQQLLILLRRAFQFAEPDIDRIDKLLQRLHLAGEFVRAGPYRLAPRLRRGDQRKRNDQG